MFKKCLIVAVIVGAFVGTAQADDYRTPIRNLVKNVREVKPLRTLLKRKPLRTLMDRGRSCSRKSINDSTLIPLVPAPAVIPDA